MSFQIFFSGKNKTTIESADNFCLPRNAAEIVESEPYLVTIRVNHGTIYFFCNILCTLEHSENGSAVNFFFTLVFIYFQISIRN